MSCWWSIDWLIGGAVHRQTAVIFVFYGRVVRLDYRDESIMLLTFTVVLTMIVLIRVRYFRYF